MWSIWIISWAVFSLRTVFSWIVVIFDLVIKVIISRRSLGSNELETTWGGILKELKEPSNLPLQQSLSDTVGTLSHVEIVATLSRIRGNKQALFAIQPGLT